MKFIFVSSKFNDYRIRSVPDGRLHHLSSHGDQERLVLHQMLLLHQIMALSQGLLDLILLLLFSFLRLLLEIVDHLHEEDDVLARPTEDLQPAKLHCVGILEGK